MNTTLTEFKKFKKKYFMNHMRFAKICGVSTSQLSRFDHNNSEYKKLLTNEKFLKKIQNGMKRAKKGIR